MEIRAPLFFLVFVSFSFLYLACGATPVSAHVVRVSLSGPGAADGKRIETCGSCCRGHEEEVKDIRKEPEIGGM